MSSTVSEVLVIRLELVVFGFGWSLHYRDTLKAPAVTNSQTIVSIILALKCMPLILFYHHQVLLSGFERHGQVRAVM
jgi:hypothetical protein